VSVSKTKDGDNQPRCEFPVMVGDDDNYKTMIVTDIRLLDLLINEDKKASLIGRTFRIKAIGNGMKRDWVVAATEGTIRAEFAPIFYSQKKRIEEIKKDTSERNARIAANWREASEIYLAGSREYIERSRKSMKESLDTWDKMIKS